MYKLDKDEVFVLNQPCHTIFSLVVVDSVFPISSDVHDALGKLAEVSDLVFVFSDNFGGSINRMKFSSLYNACAWLDSGDSISDSLFKVLQYDLEVFEGQHISYLVYNSSDLTYIGNEFIDQIQKINMMSISKPIFKSRRLSSEEYYEIYKLGNNEKSKLRIFESKKEKKSDISNMYCSYTSDSSVLFFKRGTIDLFVKFWCDPETKAYIGTFQKWDCRYLFASLTKRLGIDTFDCNIEELKIS